MLNLINMSISQTKVTADEETSETQNLIPNVMKRDNDTGLCSKDYSKLGKIRITFVQKNAGVLDFSMICILAFFTI